MDFWERICAQLHLGRPLSPPVPLTGGFLHRMYSLRTDAGRYAVKLLNPHIMERPEALENYRTAEALEARLEERDLSILPALPFFGEKLQNMDGQYFYVFPYFAGQALPENEITAAHCSRIGAFLAALHGIERRQMTPGPRELRVDWAFYADRLESCEPSLAALLRQSLPCLRESEALANAAFAKLPGVLTICHNDLDPKNVLWQGEEFRAIDLECLGWGDPWIELIETALSWSGFPARRMDYVRLGAFLHAYADAGGTLPTDWAVCCDADCGRLEWLEYSLRRVLGIGCGPEEKEMGIAETRNTLALVQFSQRERETILEFLTTL